MKKKEKTLIRKCNITDMFFCKINTCFKSIADWCVRRSMLCFAALFVFSLMLKLLVHLLDPVIGRDAALYCHIAKVWSEGSSFADIPKEYLPDVGWLPPLLFFLMKCGMAAGFSATTVGWCINIVCGTLCTLAGYGIALEATKNKKIALISAAFFAVHPGITGLSVEIQRDAVYLCLIGFVIWFALAGFNRKNIFLWCASGVFCSLSLLTRYETFELLPLVAFFLLAAVCCRKLSWKNAALYAFAFYLFCAGSFYAAVHGMETPQIVERYQKYFTGKSNKVQKQYATPQMEEIR